MIGVLKKIFGSKHEKDVTLIRPLVDEINGHFQEYQSLSDDQLREKTTDSETKAKWEPGIPVAFLPR